MPLRESLIDGELVIDVDPRTKKVRYLPPSSLSSCVNRDLIQETLRFLAFDCLVVDSVNIMSKTLDKRYGVQPSPFSFPWRNTLIWMSQQRLKQQFHRPYEKMMQQFPGMGADQPFQCVPLPLSSSFLMHLSQNSSERSRTIIQRRPSLRQHSKAPTWE